MRAGVGFAGMRMGRATDKGDEFAASHGAPKAKDHDLIITPRIAARSGHLCPLRVKSGGDDRGDAAADVCFAPESGQIADRLGMSALCHNRTHATQQNRALFDHLRGARAGSGRAEIACSSAAQISICSAIATASSSSISRYLRVRNTTLKECDQFRPALVRPALRSWKR